jgi:hypothetical protein
VKNKERNDRKNSKRAGKKWFEIILRLVWRSPGFKDHTPEPGNCNKSGVVLRIRVHNDNSLILYPEKQVMNLINPI